MTAEKPKHKPQPKRTLEDVLRSLQDLVRNDLGGGAPGVPPGAPGRRSPASDEPDSFNEALTRLDQMIDKKIVAPAEPAPRAATTHEALEIDWDGFTDAPAANRSGDAGTHGAPEPATVAAEHPDAEASRGDEHGGRPPPDEVENREVELSGSPAFDTLDTIELEAAAAPEEDMAPGPTPAGELQEAFRFADPDGDGPRRTAETSAPDDGRPLENRIAGSAEAFEMPAVEPKSFATTDETSLEAGTDVSGLGGEEPAMTSNENREAAGGDRPAATDHAPDADENRMRDTPRTTSAPETRQRPDAGNRDTAGLDPPTLEEEIPVLNEVAPVEPPRAAGLPDRGRARDAAIRAVARLNVERRKAGEAPLDVKTIERLQQYLAEALVNPKAGTPK